MDWDHSFAWDDQDEMYIVSRVGPYPSRSVEPNPREKSRGGAETGPVDGPSGLRLSPKAPRGA